MKIYLAIIAFLFISLGMHANCTNAYASAGYSLSHAKKSMSANNFEHQQYYAERALMAFEKAQSQIENCGCQASLDPILDGIENLETALSQTEWDMGRFYTKKALGNAQDLLNSLDECTIAKASDYEAGLEETQEVASDEIIALSENAEEVSTLEMQLDFKQLAETDIADLERSIRELATLFQCEKALTILKELKPRTEEELKAESLENTKAYYLSQVVSIHNKALFAMIECSKK
ncbi:MAG: hypothetical protein HKP53_02755 [Eudoraea sp.]|nr:hypothetical protein [Eudoraea sp.]